MGQRLAVSEFPNDNPELHDGLVWACPSPCAPALPTLRLRKTTGGRVLGPDWERASSSSATVSAEPVVREAVPPVSHAEPEVSHAEVSVSHEVPDVSHDEVVVSHAETIVTPVDPASEPAAPSGFGAFVGALAGILAERGATRAAANVGALLGQARLAPDAFDEGTKKTLVARGTLDANTGRPTPEFSVVARAWRDVLDENGGDLSACGSATLDVFGAELLAALLGSPRSADELRRALRQRGVAAFGMLLAA